ncbi:hypothetical protein M885DRAFT_511102 [Pelagophyceae sp. CCMP2097]|nr:hypothetical protein M885DRAFT_511102 [Pelagophyceae sp. CCMP2097]|mmetsp:Transcript_28792/g.97047  ORF Transcript_28792/g.97047 Transcript_28792/m.97047 type:complete len:468 (-) Transcript_28792:12-1415(-)
MRWGAYCTLQLAVAGSGVLPLPSVFAKCGVASGTVICFLVTLLNDRTTTWLIEAAYLASPGSAAAGSYSELLRRCGFGERCVFCAELAAFGLLFGSVAACLACAGEASAKLVGDVFEALALAGGDGAVELTRAVSPLLACALACALGLRSFSAMRYASALGVGFLGLIVGAVVYAYASSDGPPTRVPGAPRGPSARYGAEWAEWPVAVTVLGYALYLGPVALAMVAEATALGVEEIVDPTVTTTKRWGSFDSVVGRFDSVSAHENGPEPQAETPADRYNEIRVAVHQTYACSFVLYTALGASGALWLGEDTPTDIVTAFRGKSSIAISAATVAYLWLSTAPMLIPLRDSVFALTARRPAADGAACRSKGSAVRWRLQFGATLAAIFTAAALSLALRSLTLFSLTGATGVCATCYIIPVACRWALQKRSGDATRRAAALPGLCLACGTALSVFSLAQTLAEMLNPPTR